MEPITLAKASLYSSPNPVTVVCTQKPDGKVNLATVSWWTYLSYNPNMVAFAMAKTSFSGEMMRRNKKAVITIPGTALADTVLGCGMTTGRDTDKVSKFGVALQTVEGCPIQIPQHSRLAVLCSLKETVETGDHYLYICQAEQVYADEKEEALFAWNGYSQIRPAK